MPTSIDEVRRDLLALSLLKGSFDTTPCRMAKALIEAGETDGMTKAVAQALWTEPGAAEPEIARVMAAADRAIGSHPPEAHFVTILDEGYPDLLRMIADPPLVIWVAGDVEALATTSVAVVGSRDAMPVSLAIARKLGRELSDAGVTVVSGLARGVDGASHVGALEGAGQTIAVLGSGLSHIYPERHSDLARRVQERGAVVTEFPPEAVGLPTHFPLRNRIISGLSRAVVVVEAGENSGSLITARMAMQQNRSVMAVPGGPLSGRHRGAHGLIQDGARLVETVEDILDEIQWCGGPPVKKDRNPLKLSELEAKMAMGESYSIDELAERTGRIAGDLVAELATLELAGRVQRVCGGHFARFPR